VGVVGSALKLLMDKSGDDRAVTIELPPGTETITPGIAHFIMNITSPSHVAIDGHNRVLKLDDPGTLLTVGEGVTLTLRNITLMGNNNNRDPLVEVQARGRLVLGDGATLTGNKTYGVTGGVWVNGGELVMNEGAEIKIMEILFDLSSSGTKGGGVLISNRGRFIMYGGTINGNILSSTIGYNDIKGIGGVAVLDGSFDMYGGSIQSNSTSSHYSFYGGVGVFQRGAFTMYRGTINGNTGDDGGGVGISGGIFTMNGAEAVIEGNIGQGSSGGVLVGYQGTFTMYAGIIQENTAQSGGGVYVSNQGTFTMCTGTIKGNTAHQSGGGVYIAHDGIFNMNGGTIKKNTAQSGGGVVVEGTFNMNGGTIGGNPGDANTAASGANGVYNIYGGGFIMSGGIITGNTASGTNNYGVSGPFTMMGSAQVTQDNPVLLSGVVTIGGDLENSPAANIIYNSIPASGNKLLRASSSALITENYDKFLYNGGSIHINDTPISETAYGQTTWYGVCQ
jgi:hypothetical protein